MTAFSSTPSQPAMFAGKDRTQPMPSHSRMAAMCAATASIVLIRTGAITPVSLFALVLSLVLLTFLVVLISLILSGLTGRVSLVGLIVGLAPGTIKGE